MAISSFGISVVGISATQLQASNPDLTATGIATGAPVVGSPGVTQAHVLTANGIITGAPVVGHPQLNPPPTIKTYGLSDYSTSLREGYSLQIFPEVGDVTLNRPAILP